MLMSREKRKTKLNHYRLMQNPHNQAVVFNNKMREDLLENMPKTEEDLCKLAGWKAGGERVNKHGKSVLEIIWAQEENPEHKATVF